MSLGKIKPDRPFILASCSPRRSILLSQLLSDFQVIPSGADEIQPGSMEPVELVKENAKIKCFDIASKYEESWVLGADTLVALGDHVLGKPKDIEDAVRSLLMLSGKKHSVYTGIALSCFAEDKRAVAVVESIVSFKELNEQQIRSYFEKVNPLDKAGSYAIQEYGDKVVEHFEGSLNNIIGLPTEFLSDWLKQHIL